MADHSNHMNNIVVTPSGIPAYYWLDIGLTLLYSFSSI